MKSQKGLTLIELVLAISIILILGVSLFVAAYPPEYKAKARDRRRLSDMATLDRAINEYFLDDEAYPGAPNTLCTSTSLPSGSPGPLENAQTGWIDANFSVYIPKLPLDPLNDETYFYSYRHANTTYELNAVLEYFSEYMENDGGNNTGVYELGNDLTIL